MNLKYKLTILAILGCYLEKQLLWTEFSPLNSFEKLIQIGLKTRLFIMLEIGPFWLTVALLISETIKDMPNLFNNTCQKNQKESKDKSLSKSDLKYKYTLLIKETFI